MADLDNERPGELLIDTKVEPTGETVLILSGELDISTADSLQKMVASITTENLERLTFDLSDLRFMDSAGIAVLVHATNKVETVQLRDPSPIVRRVVELMGLSDVLPIQS